MKTKAISKHLSIAALTLTATLLVAPATTRQKRYTPGACVNHALEAGQKLVGTTYLTDAKC